MVCGTPSPRCGLSPFKPLKAHRVSDRSGGFPRPARAPPERGANLVQAVSVATSTLMPGPMEEDTATFFT